MKQGYLYIFPTHQIVTNHNLNVKLPKKTTMCALLLIFAYKLNQVELWCLIF